MKQHIDEAVDELRKKIQDDQENKLRIALFGQPGAGKSSLVNRIIGKNVAKSGAGTDITVVAQEYEYDGLYLVDLPGYGTSKFSPDSWIKEFNPADFDLFLCVFSGKFHEADSKFFRELQDAGRVCLFVRNKHDDLWQEGKETVDLENEIIADVNRQVGKKQQVYFVSCRSQKGLPELVDGIMQALDPAKKEKYQRSAKAYTKAHLEAKKAAADKLVGRYAAVAAANGINPIPGVDIGVDISIMLTLFAKIRESYGLSEEKIQSLGASLLPLGKKLIDVASKEGIILFIKRFGTQTASKEISKYIPLVGQVIAASVGYGMTLMAGKSYLDECHELAEQILEQELSRAKG